MFDSYPAESNSSSCICGGWVRFRAIAWGDEVRTSASKKLQSKDNLFSTAAILVREDRCQTYRHAYSLQDVLEQSPVYMTMVSR